MKTLILTAEDTRTIVQQVGLDAIMDQMIARLHDALERFDESRTEIPLRSGFHYREPVDGLIEWMPVMQAGGTATIKVVGYHPENPGRFDLPTILGTVSNYDTRTGHLAGLADGTFLTALRTGAASAIATRVFAREDSETIGLVGCGAQAIAQLHAVSRVRGVRRVLLFDTDSRAMDSFSGRASVLDLPDVAIESVTRPELLLESDVICTATSVGVNQGPVFTETPCKPSLHINAAGSDFEGKFEIPVTLLRRSLVCPDVPDQAMMQGECQQLDASEIGASLVEVVKNPDGFMAHRSQLTIFDSTGWALEDQVALDMLMGLARDLGVGSEVEIESVSMDAKNPYDFAFNGRAAFSA